MGGGMVHLDTVVVPLSMFIAVSYHAYLWHCFTNKSPLTTISINALRRRRWFLKFKDKEGNDKMEMLAVQSLRNKLMDSILAATVAMTIAVALAALTSNSYTATATHSSMIHSPLLGMQQSAKLHVLKFGSTCVLLLISFLFSSSAIAFLIDANFLINAPQIDKGYTQRVLETGFLLGLIGNRLLCISFPLLFWMFGPFPVAFSSLALVCCLYRLDFAAAI